MAIPSEVGGVRIAATHFLARTFICLLGLGAVAWGGFALPLFWQQASVNRVASELLQGHAFKMQWLLDEARQVEAAEPSSFCNPTALHNLVVLRLAILNEAIAAPTIRSSIRPMIRYMMRREGHSSCAPADPFVWLTLFWLDAGKRGFDVRQCELFAIVLRSGSKRRLDCPMAQ